jgi:hypothetical protein
MDVKEFKRELKELLVKAELMPPANRHGKLVIEADLTPDLNVGAVKVIPPPVVFR